MNLVLMLGKIMCSFGEPVWKHLVKNYVSISYDQEYFPEKKTHKYTERDMYENIYCNTL